MRELMSVSGLSKNALINHLNRLMVSVMVERVARGRYPLTIDGQELANTSAGSIVDSSKRQNAKSAHVMEEFDRLFPFNFQGKTEKEKNARWPICREMKHHEEDMINGMKEALRIWK